LVAEELDAHRAIHFRRIDIQYPTAQRDLTGHLDDIDTGVADREQMLDEHIGENLVVVLQVQCEGCIMFAGKKPHAGSFDGCDDEACGSGGDLPQRSCTCFENFWMG